MSHFPGRRFSFAILALLAGGSLRASDTYSVIHVEGQVSGYSKTTTRELKEGERQLFETTSSQTFRLSRLDVAVEIEGESSVVEDAAGAIVRVNSRMKFAKNDTVHEGVVRDGTLEYTTTTAGQPRSGSMAFDDDIPGPRERNRRIVATQFRPGAEVRYYHFDFNIGEPVEMSLTFEATERVDDLPSGARTLHRFRSKSDNPSIPPSTLWVDETGETRKETTNMLGMSFVTLDATLEQYQTAGGTKGAEVFVQSMIESNRRLEDPRALQELVYRLEHKQGGELTLPTDERQSWITVDGEKLYSVKTLVPREGGKQTMSRKFTDSERLEALVANAMIQSDDPKIIAFAREVIGEETNAWAAAQKLEAAVMKHVKNKSMAIAFGSATEVFEDCEGDCTEHAVLLAACCRAVGIPARVAMGLVYVEMNGKGVFGGHAWTEVSIDDRWYGLDATLGSGSADPTHIRMASGSLKDGAFQSAFAGILQNLGNLSLEIVSGTR
jgi:Transglutaminase-like superfamily